MPPSLAHYGLTARNTLTILGAVMVLRAVARNKKEKPPVFLHDKGICYYLCHYG